LDLEKVVSENERLYEYKWHHAISYYILKVELERKNDKKISKRDSK